MDPSQRKLSWALWSVAAASFGVLLVHDLWVGFSQTDAIPYSQFEQLVAQGKIAEATVGTDRIAATLKEPADNGHRYVVATRVDPALADRLSAKGVVVKGAPSTGFMGVKRQSSHSPVPPVFRQPSVTPISHVPRLSVSYSEQYSTAGPFTFRPLPEVAIPRSRSGKQKLT